MTVTLKKPVQYLLLTCLCMVPLACSETPGDEQVIRQHLRVMEKAAEDKQSSKILDFLDENFLGNEQFRKANIKGMLFLHFRRHKNVHVFLHDVTVEMTEEGARVNCQVILAGRDEKIMPDRARILEIKSEWVKRDDEWRVARASWKDPYYQPLTN